MKWGDYIDEKELRTAISTLQAPDKVFEVRVIGTAKKDIISGYFKDADTLLRAFNTIDLRARNVYITLGELKDECFSRAQSERFLKSPQTSSDTEVERYRWLFVDLDPVRSAGISSSGEELATAEILSKKVREYLKSLDFEEPVFALSGNGYHLLYRIDVPNDSEGRLLVENCLKALSEMFDTPKIKIDTTNSNPSRICKLHGTMAQKGRSTKDRPHRMSRLLFIPEEIKVTPQQILQTLAGEATASLPATYASNSRENFDLVQFMLKNGIGYREGANDRARIFYLNECPFDPSHKDGDARIFQYTDGAISFKCHHNSCKQYKWPDVRRKFEPDAYEKNQRDDERIDQGYREHIEKKELETILEAPRRIKKKRKTRTLHDANSLLKKKLPPLKVYVGVGETAPFLVEGTCILAAKPKLGKSWLALCMCLAIANGDDFLGFKTHRCSTLYLDLETAEIIQQTRLKQTLKGAPAPKNLYIESETDKIDDGFVEQLEAYLKEDPDIGVVVVDMFEGIRTAVKNQKETEYSHSYRDIDPLNELAKKHHISIVLVCHTRKAVDPDDKFSNILGSIGLQGAAAQMIVISRKGEGGPRTISVRGRAIDGDVTVRANLEQHEWTLVDGSDDVEAERVKAITSYRESEIRAAILKIIENDGQWKGRATDLIRAAADYELGVRFQPLEVGRFLNKNIGLLMAEDSLHVEIIKNGTSSNIYRIWKSPLITIDGSSDGGAQTQ